MKKIFLVLALLVMVSSCSDKAKENLGLKIQAPDENVVTSRPPLIIPPDFDATPVTEGTYSEFKG